MDGVDSDINPPVYASVTHAKLTHTKRDTRFWNHARIIPFLSQVGVSLWQ